MKLKCLFLSTVLTSSAFADIEMPSFFSDGMVLQRDKGAALWGNTKPGSEVTVEFAGLKKKVKASASGAWRIVFDGLKMNKSGANLVVQSAGDKKVFSDVLVGDVWIVSGQSNMELKMSEVNSLPG